MDNSKSHIKLGKRVLYWCISLAGILGPCRLRMTVTAALRKEGFFAALTSGIASGELPSLLFGFKRNVSFFCGACVHFRRLALKLLPSVSGVLGFKVLVQLRAEAARLQLAGPSWHSKTTPKFCRTTQKHKP